MLQPVRDVHERTSRNQGDDAIFRYQAILKANTSWLARLADLQDNLTAVA